MIIFIFKGRLKPEKAGEALAAFESIIPAVRAVEGVMAFDFALDVTDSNTIIGTQVYADHAAWQREESHPKVRELVRKLPDLLAADAEMTVFDASPYKGGH